MTYAHTNSINLSHELHGRGEPLVLIPGLGYGGCPRPVGGVWGVRHRAVELRHDTRADVT